jgi:hypothetical protein
MRWRFWMARKQCFILLQVHMWILQSSVVPYLEFRILGNYLITVGLHDPW